MPQPKGYDGFLANLQALLISRIDEFDSLQISPNVDDRDHATHVQSEHHILKL